MSSERVFIVGGTGNIGTRCVKDLLENNVAVTLYARNPDKVNSLFPNHGSLLNVVQGDFNDLTCLQEAIQGHSRLLLLISDFTNFVKTKTTIAKYAYDAGVKQIIDISGFCINPGWRTTNLSHFGYESERLMLDIPNRGYLVTLRPNRFMSNIFRQIPIKNGAIFDSNDDNEPQGWISPEDIGAVAATIFCEDIHKHADAIYNLIGQVMTPVQRAEDLSRIIEKEIKYQKVPATIMYQNLIGTGFVPHILAIELCHVPAFEAERIVSPCIEILLGRKPQTFEEYLIQYKALLN